MREKAYVINLECVKMIVTQDQARTQALPHISGPACPDQLFVYLAFTCMSP